MLTGLCPYQMAQLWKELFLKGGGKIHFLAASPRNRVVVSSSLVAGGCFHHLKECHSLPTPDKVVYFLKANYESQMKLAPRVITGGRLKKWAGDRKRAFSGDEVRRLRNTWKGARRP